MEDYKQKQFKIEYDYIMNKYFSDIKPLTDFEPVKGRSVLTCNILLDGKPYIAYKYELNSTIFVPMVDDIFKGDFDPIYKLSVHKNENIFLSVIKKKNGMIEEFVYNFGTNNTFSNDTNCVELVLYYSNIDDSNNNLKEKYLSDNVSLEIFLSRGELGVKDLSKEYKIINIKKYENGLSFKSIYDSYEELFRDYVNDVQKFEPIELEDDISLIETADKMLDSSKKEKVKK